MLITLLTILLLFVKPLNFRRRLKRASWMVDKTDDQSADRNQIKTDPQDS